MAERIRDCIALQLQRAADPRFELVTVTSVMVTPDLRLAKVYWVATGGGERVQDVSEAFEKATGLFKRAIASELKVKFVPEIRFYYDDTLDTVASVEGLLARAGMGGPPDSEIEDDGDSEDIGDEFDEDSVEPEK